MSENELEEIGRGYSVVSDPIYKLTESEERVLRKAGYNIKKTNSGNCRVTDSHGNTIDPKTLEGMCKVVGIAEQQAKNDNRYRGRSFWDILFS